MDDPGGVGLGQAVGDLDRAAEYVVELHAFAADQLVEGFAFHIFHDHEIEAVVGGDVVYDDDVGMVERGCGLGFLDEPLLALRVGQLLVGEDLDGHDAVEMGVLRLVDGAHAAFADFLQDVVVKKRLAGYGHQVSYNSTASPKSS